MRSQYTSVWQWRVQNKFELIICSIYAHSWLLRSFFAAHFQVRPALVHEPETLEALEALVKDHNGRGQRLRAVGSGLSPNGIGFCANGGACVNLASMDQILSVDAAKQQVCS